MSDPKTNSQGTLRAVEERLLRQALLQFLKTQRDLKTFLNALEPKRPRGRHPSPYSQPKRKRSIIGATAYWKNPAKAQALLLEQLNQKAEEIENQKSKTTGHCESATVHDKEKNK